MNVAYEGTEAVYVIVGKDREGMLYTCTGRVTDVNAVPSDASVALTPVDSGERVVEWDMEEVIGLPWKKDVSELKCLLVGVLVPLDVGGSVKVLLETDDTVNVDDADVELFVDIVASDREELWE